MAEWLFDKSGNARAILDHNKIRDSRGEVVAWMTGENLYSLGGSHMGWVEGGVIYDCDNCAIGFTRNRTGSLPSVPGLSGVPGMPGFSGVPGRPGFSGIPGKPGRGGWSNRDLEHYLKSK